MQDEHFISRKQKFVLISFCFISYLSDIKIQLSFRKFSLFFASSPSTFCFFAASGALEFLLALKRLRWSPTHHHFLILAHRKKGPIYPLSYSITSVKTLLNTFNFAYYFLIIYSHFNGHS